MPFGFETGTSQFDSTTHDAIKQSFEATLRAGLIALPKGAVVPADLYAQRGQNFDLRLTLYPDLEDGAETDPLTEGVPPSPLLLGISTLDFTVGQVGAWTSVTDIAEFQSPHKLPAVAMDKIVRLAAQKVDSLMLAELLAATQVDETGSVLTTAMVLDAKAALAERNVQPIPGVGYYCITSPSALRGLEGEADLNGYVDVTKHGKGADLTMGAVSQYRGVTFVTSSRIRRTDFPAALPAIFLGKDSIAFGDISTIEFFRTSAPDSANPLAQFKTAGFKGILGGTVVDFSETTDGAGNNAADTSRIYVVDVDTGVGS